MAELSKLPGADKLRPLAAHLPIVLVTAWLAYRSIRAVLAQTGGEPAVPLDDTYIHFQYARAFAELHPFAYTRGADPAPGTTSLIWPLILAPFQAIGVRGTGLIWVVWTLGWVSLGLLAHDTWRAAARIVSREGAIAAAAMVLLFGGNAWFATSGMEVVPLGWVLVRSARRAAEWCEAHESDALLGEPSSIRRIRRELVLIGLLAPALRPEGALASLVAIAALLRVRASRSWALYPALGIAIPPLVLFTFTGHATTTTAIVKWLPLNPYQTGGRLFHTILSNVGTLFGTLLDGQLWSSVFLPRGGRVVAWLALPALGVAALKRGVRFRGLVLLAVGAGILIPTSYDSFLWNRLRYLWPFAAPWFIGLAALADGIGALFGRLQSELALSRVLIAGGFVGTLASHLSYAIEDVATSADGVRRQQVDIGRWARDALPRSARVGVNDTGAIAYYSDRETFDVVGLTTAGEARYWVAGAGSRFEHYEKLDRAHLPTHFLVYREWFALSPLLGRELTERYVPEATILGGTTKAAYEADWSALGSAAMPSDVAALGPLLDELDVADLESEAKHRYELFSATQTENYVVESSDGRVDGARGARTLERFELELRASGTLVARLGSEAPSAVVVRAGGRELGRLSLTGSEWQEAALALPRDLAGTRQLVELEAAKDTSFVALHYYSHAPR